MSEYRINKVNISLLKTEIKVWTSSKGGQTFRKSKQNLFSHIIEGEQPQFYSFEFADHAIEIIVNLEKERYFVKPYIEYFLKRYFYSTNLKQRKNFIDSIQLWKISFEDNSYWTYDKFSVRIISSTDLNNIELLLTYDGESIVSKQCLNINNLNNEYKKYIEGQNIYDIKRTSSDSENSYPILTNKLKAKAGLIKEGYKVRNTYLEYYQKISSFYDEYLKSQKIVENIHFISETFNRVDEKRIQKTKFVSNYLKFNNQKDYNIYSGLKNYGPYKVPNTSNLRFIFVFRNDDVHRATANKLFHIFTTGLTNTFPGLKDYVKINFQLADINKIILETSELTTEFESKLSSYSFDPLLQYFVVLLTDHKKVDDTEGNSEEYYKLKYSLLKRGILSQFIFYKNVSEPNFKYHLPNIAVAMLAKLGGIPWKLDTIAKNKLVIGFGVKRIGNLTYLGNTLCFKEDGEFYKFETYERNNINTLGEALQDSILSLLVSEHIVPDKLIIHYYKTLSEEEADQIETILKRLKLDIPFIVLTINDTKSKDYVFFDVSSKDIMPVSGTILELKPQSEYLLANNERHTENQIYSIRKYPFPLKIKVNRPTNTLYDIFDVKELVDEVYSFSRIYWKSINQVSLPVTIAYSKIVAELAAHFPDHKLPDEKIAHSNLWFL
jgi:hypothetical protein